jgi:GAF domain-containing protein
MASSVSDHIPKTPQLPDISIIHAFAQISATIIDLDDLLLAGLDMLRQFNDYDLLALVFIDDETGQPEIRAYKSDLLAKDDLHLQTFIADAIEQGVKTKKENIPLRKNAQSSDVCLIIPLTIGRLVIGALVVAEFWPHQFSDAEEMFLSIFASQLTVAVTNVRLYERTREQQQQEFIRRQIATHLQQLSTIINATLNLDDVLNLILEHIKGVIPYHSALIMLLKDQHLAVQAVAGLNEEIKPGLALSAHSGGFYHLMLLQQYPSVFFDVTEHKLWSHTCLPTVQSIRAWIGAPLIIKNQIIGILTLHHREAGYFDNADLDLVHTFANQAAIAIDNAQVYQREQQKVKQFQTVAKIGRQATEIHEVQSLLDTVVERLVEDLNYEFVTILLYQNETDSLHLKAANDIAPQVIDALNYSLPLEGLSVISTAGRTGDPLVVNDVSSFEGYVPHPRRKLVRSELAIPLVTKDQLIGLLDIQSTHLHAFSPDDLVLAQTIADQLAVTIANANMFEDKDGRIAELIAFNEIGGVMAKPGDLNNTLLTIIERIKALYQVEGASLLVLENDILRFRVVTGYPLEALKLFELKLGEGVAGWVAKHNQSLTIDNVASDPRHYKKIDEALDFTTKSLLAVPVQIQGRVLGVIEIMNRLDGLPFTRDDEVILAFIASAIAITMENSRLFGELAHKAEQMAGLFEASQSLAKLDLDEVLRITVRQVVNLLNSQWATVYLIDDSKELAVPGANYSVGDVHMRPRVFEIGQGAVGWVLKHKTLLRVNDAQNDVHFLSVDQLSYQVVNVLTAPLIARGEIIGILETATVNPSKPFNEEDEAFITALASQAAMAIHNAQLYQAVLDREEFVLALGEASSSINQSLNLDEVLDIICSKSLTLFDIDAISVWRAENDHLLCLAASGLGAAETLETSLANDDSSFISQVYNFGQPQYQNNVNSLDKYLPHIQLKSNRLALMGIPLLTGERCVGVLLMLTARELNYFTPEIQTRAVIYSSQITSAIENAHLHQQTTVRLAEVSTLYTLAHQMSINLEIDPLLEGTINVIRLALDCSGGSLFLLKADEELVLGAQNGKTLVAAQAYVDQVIQLVMRTQRPVNLKNKADFVRIIGEPSPSDVQSLLIVPLLAHGNLLGALVMFDELAYAFGDDEGRLLTIVAAQVASAIENSMLYNDLQQHAQSLEKALSELQEFSQLQGEFVQNVSHELRTPLTFVKAYVDLVLEESLGPISDGIRNSLQIVARRTDDLNRLVSDIISHQQLQMGNLEFSDVDLRDLINLNTESALPMAQKQNLHLRTHIPNDLPLIQADPNRISQVLDNLIGNAIKFTSGGGTIDVSVLPYGEFVKLSVKDTGIGIEEGEQEKIFNRFYQVDGSTTRRFSGTGLGLTIVQQIVEAHQGQVQVKSKPGRGTEFIITLPVSQSATPNDPQQPR